MQGMTVTGLALAPTQSIAQFVIEQLLKGLVVQVTIDGKVYEGYIHNLDFYKEAGHAFASVYVPDLGGGTIVRAVVFRDGRIQMLPQSASPDPAREEATAEPNAGKP